MAETLFEGSIVLEKVAEIGKLDEFFEALDSDNIQYAKSIMKKANLDFETIEATLKKIRRSDVEG